MQRASQGLLLLSGYLSAQLLKDSGTVWELGEVAFQGVIRFDTSAEPESFQKEAQGIPRPETTCLGPVDL